MSKRFTESEFETAKGAHAPIMKRIDDTNINPAAISDAWERKINIIFKYLHSVVDKPIRESLVGWK